MADKTELKPRGRPPIEIDLALLEKLRTFHLTQEEIAAVLGCTRRTLIKRLKDDPEVLFAYESGILKGKANLRRLQWRHANGHGSGAVNMTIHLSKHWLGETDKTAMEVSPIELVITRIERVIVDSSQDQYSESLPPPVIPKALQGR